MVEILRDGRPVAPGETGRVVVTILRDRTMPLIRYDLGDVARLDAEPCPCGRTTLRLDALLGRTSEVVRTGSGTFLHSQFLMRTFLALAGTTRFQVEAVHGDTLRIRVETRDAKVRAALPEVEQAIRALDANLRVDWVQVDEIPAMQGQKRQIFVAAGPQPFAALSGDRFAGPPKS